MSWFKRETAPAAPEKRGYTDAVTQAIIDHAARATNDGYIAGLEIAAGQLSRAFMSAGVSGPGAPAFPPDVMGQIGRALVEAGEAVWYRRAMNLVRAQTYTPNTGGTWTVTAAGTAVVVPANRLFVARWNVDIDTGYGVAPLTMAQTLKTMAQRLETSLMQEAGAAVGYLLPIPQDAGNVSNDDLKRDLASLEGKIALIETVRGGWGDGTQGAPRQDYLLSRLGPQFPASSIELYTTAQESVLAACGYPVQLIQKSDGTAQREAWRRYLHGSVAPLARVVEQAAAQVNLPISISFDALFASDITGRARAFQSLVGAGMSLPEAAAASGILGVQE